MKFPKIKNIKEDISNSTIEIYGDKRIIVFDCNSVIDYTQEVIVLDLGVKKVKITGKNLTADSFVFGQTDITGEICSLEFI